MASRKELIREYKEAPKPAGIFQIKNLANGKVLLGSSLNLHGPLNKHRFMLRAGSHDNRELQKDWNAFGPSAFTFEILEEVRVKDSPDFSLDDELTLLEEIWLERLDPFGDRGYNLSRRIREA
jgi:group I intron endonuclease